MASLQERRAKMIDRGRGDLVRICPVCDHYNTHSIHSGLEEY